MRLSQLNFSAKYHPAIKNNIEPRLDIYPISFLISTLASVSVLVLVSIDLTLFSFYSFLVFANTLSFTSFNNSSNSKSSS